MFIAAFVGLAAVARTAASPRWAKVCLLLALIFGGAWLERTRRPGPAPVIEAEAREILLLSGCVVEPPALYPERTRFVLELEPGARVRVALYPRPGERPPKLRYGQRVEVEARIRKVRNYGNPGAFDIETYLARRDIYWTASARAGAPVHVLPGECGSPWKRPIYALRSWMLGQIERLYEGRPYETGMMQALLTGEKSNVDERWTDQFRLTGTYHALVISGLHLGVLAAAVVLLLRCCLISDVTAACLAAGLGWIYAVLVGWQAPVVRAATGVTLYAGCRFFYRRARPLNLVAAAAILLLVSDPGQLFEASFQLSFLSVAAIGALAIPLIERTSAPYRRALAGLGDQQQDPTLPPRTAQLRVELRLIAETIHLLTRIPGAWLSAALSLLVRAVFYIYELAVVSTCVQAGLLLPMAVYFHQFTIAALTANLAVVPLMSLCVPVGMLGAFTGWRPVAEAAAWLLLTARRVVAWHVSWQPELRIPDPPLWLAVSLAASLVLLAVLWAAPGRWRWGAGALFLSLAALLVWYPFPPLVTAGHLEVAALDVGQGDALLLALPDGRLMCLDAGGLPNFAGRASGFDTGEDVVSPYLWRRRIRRLDVVALSHLHEDHSGGAPALIRNFRPKEIWTGALPEGAPAIAVQQAAREVGAQHRELRAGETLTYGGVRFEVIAAGRDRRPPAASDRDSLVLRVSYGARSFLLTGDLDPAVERALVAQNRLPASDVVKIPHHGSRRSSSPAFLEKVRPSIALISAGAGNSYGHPHPEVLSRLEQMRVTPFRTDVWGLVRVWTDGERLEADTFRWSAAREKALLGRF